MENSNNETPIKKNNKGLVAVLAIVIIAILVGVGYYFLKPSTPKDVFVSKLNATIDESSAENSNKSDVVNSTVTISGNIESSDEQIKQVAQYVNEGKISLNVQADKKSKKAAVTANIDYKNENLLTGKVFYANDNNIYLYVKDLFDKYFKFDLKETLKEGDLDGIFSETSLTLGKKINQKKANQIVKDTISNNLKDEYFSKEEVDGMTKNTMKLTVAELKKVISDVITSLKDNENYLSCYENKDEIKKTFEEAIKGINEIDKEYDNCTLEISLYTKGLSKDVQKMEIRAIISENDEGTFTINKKDKDSYEFNLSVKTKESNMKVNAEALNGTIKREKIDNKTEKYTIVVDNIPEVGKITLNIEVKAEENTDLDSIDVSNSVDINNLSQSDAMKLYSNLMNMKIYSFIAPFLMD